MAPIIPAGGVGVGAQAATAITPAKPAVTGGILTTDVILGVGETVGGATFPTIATNGFAHVPFSPVNVDTTTALHVVWRRGDFTAHAWGDSGDHNIGAYITVRGAKSTGNPWNVDPVPGSEATLDLSVAWPAVSTTVADTLVMFFGGYSDDVTCGVPSGGTDLASFVEHLDFLSAAGNDGAIYIATAIKAATGSTGSPTATLTGTAPAKALMTIAFESESAAPVRRSARFQSRYPHYRR